MADGTFTLEEIRKADEDAKAAAAKAAAMKSGYLDKNKDEIVNLCRKIKENENLIPPYIALGKYLDTVEGDINDPSLYKKWLKKNKNDLGEKYTGYFPSSKRLAKMEAFINANPDLSKDTLFEFDHLVETKCIEKYKEEHQGVEVKDLKGQKKEEMKKWISEKKEATSEEILNNNDYRELIRGNGGNSLSDIHLKAVVTLHRFWTAEMDFVDVDQALKMVNCKKGSVRLGDINDIEDWLADLGDGVDKKAKISGFIDNKMKFPKGWKPKRGIRFLLRKFVNICRKVEFKLDEKLSNKLRADAICVFRCKSTTDSGVSRPVIPV